MLRAWAISCGWDGANLNKTHGYVLVPLFVEQEAGETVEEAVERTEFSEIWNVLQAMQEQDDVLEDVIRQMREDRGRSGGYDDSRFREKVEFLGPSISLETLREVITAKCVDWLGITWDERFGALVRHKEEYGDCNVPRVWPDDQKLSVWANNQRAARRRGTLSKDRIRRLAELGFIWELIDAFWEEMFAELIKYKEVHGDCNVPDRWLENLKLGKWTGKQRSSFKKGTLGEERIRRLGEIGFVWDPNDALWKEMFTALVKYKEAYGDCNVPQR